jgi:hypothetical protein
MKIMISRLLIIALFFFSFLVYAEDVKDYKAEYLFETDKFSVTGIRELSSKNNIKIITFNAKTSVVKLFFESTFDIKNGSVLSQKYTANVRALLIRRNQTIEFDNTNKIIKSYGMNEWEKSYDGDFNILDPLNAQVEMRFKVKKMLDSNNFDSFQIALQDIRSGDIEVNTYKFSKMSKYEFNGSVYDSVVIKRVREQDSRITEYHLVPELGFLILEVIDISSEETQILKLQNILSLG